MGEIIGIFLIANCLSIFVEFVLIFSEIIISTWLPIRVKKGSIS